jgi:quinol monooxygenase YgiN
MYVRITRGRFDPDRVEEVQSVTAEVANAIKGLPGFVAYQGRLDRQAGTLVAVSTWEDAGSANFSREQLGNVLSRVVAVAQPKAPDIYEVVITA